MQVTNIDYAARRAAGQAFIVLSIAQGKPVAPIREALMITYMADPEKAKQQVAQMPAIGAAVTMAKSDFDHEIDGSKDVKPTPEERETARRMGLDANSLAKQRQQRTAVADSAPQDDAIFRRMGIDGERIKRFRDGTLTRDSDPALTGYDAKKVADFRDRTITKDADPALTGYDARKVADFRRGTTGPNATLSRNSLGNQGGGDPATREQAERARRDAAAASLPLNYQEREACRQFKIDPAVYVECRRGRGSPSNGGVDRDAIQAAELRKLEADDTLPELTEHEKAVAKTMNIHPKAAAALKKARENGTDMWGRKPGVP